MVQPLPPPTASSSTGPCGSHGGAAGSTSSSSGIIIIDSGPSDATFGTCVPLTCASLSVDCGPQGDGCGGMIQCGSCKSPATCGGGGASSKCGGNNSCGLRPNPPPLELFGAAPSTGV